MARGGVYDQLAGGFHRYSVDERWVVPHFEKMLYDNTELLRNYVHGFQSFVREDFLETAREIVALARRDDDRPRARRLLCARRMRMSASTTTATTLPGRWTRRARCSSVEELEFAHEVLGHWRAGRHAPQPGEECAACEVDAGGDGSAIGRRV